MLWEIQIMLINSKQKISVVKIHLDSDRENACYLTPIHLENNRWKIIWVFSIFINISTAVEFSEQENTFS